MTTRKEWFTQNRWIFLSVGCVLLVVVIIFLVWFIWRCRRRRRYDYSALKEDLSVPAKLYKEKQDRLNAIRDKFWVSLQFYMRTKTDLDLIGQLANIGSREEKWWFIVRDHQLNQDQLVSMVNRPVDLKIPFTSSTQTCLKELFSQIHHPYICPLTVEFFQEQNYIIMTQQCCRKGSLRDTIYKSNWKDPWQVKYSGQGKGLSVKLMRVYGKQILEGMLYLEKIGLPPFNNLHAGNIMIHSGVCRLCGYENAFVGLKPLHHNLLHDSTKDCGKHAASVVSFGRLLFEMCTGYDLCTPVPDAYQLLACNPAVVEVLSFIFGYQEAIYPTLKLIKDHKFFTSVTLLESVPVTQSYQLELSPATKSLLKSVRRGKPLKPSRKAKGIELSNTKVTRARRPSQDPTPSVSSTLPTHITEVPSSATQLAIILKQQQPSRHPSSHPQATVVSLTVSSDYGQSRTGLLSDIRRGMVLRQTNTQDKIVPRV